MSARKSLIVNSLYASPARYAEQGRHGAPTLRCIESLKIVELD